jgi:HD-GYP domain-containing protein (c-di-GMP phosphodiesterase class II)
MDLLLTILALADTFDSICVTKRPYAEKRSKSDAIREIRHTSLRVALDKDVSEWFCNWAEHRS